jgi:dGTPase
MYKNQGGMRLSCATLGTLLKYPWTSSESGASGKFNIYQSELEYFKAIANELGLIEIIENKKWSRHPLSYLMEAADDICYSVLDIEDAVEMGIISIDEFSTLFKEFIKDGENDSLEKNQYCALIRSRFIGSCISFVVDEFFKNYEKIMQGFFEEKDFFKNSEHPTALALKSSKKFASKKIYTHPNKVRREVGSYPCLHHLLDLFIPAVNSLYEKNGELNLLSNREKTIIKLLEKTPNTSLGKYQIYL